MAHKLNSAVAAACIDGWYSPKASREVGEVFRLGGHPVAVIAVRDERAPVGGPDDTDSDGKRSIRYLRLRDATAEEMAIAEASRAAYRAGHGLDHPARAANAAQMARIYAEAKA